MSSSVLKEIASLVFPDLTLTEEQVLERYPQRQLQEGAKVTRFAPSPTGFLHIGGIFASLASERLAHQSGGVFYLRIEDTDQKREVEGTVDLILRTFKTFDITYDEGPLLGGGEKGSYGPYYQSARRDLYQVFIRKLLEEDNAYLCFATPDELKELSEKQAAMKLQPGYYGEWALWRNKSPEEALEALKAGKEYVVRLRSKGDALKRIVIEDGIRGKIEMPENINDIVIMKRDRLPTYHFAHAIDDHLMGTNLVLRADEWVASLPIHIQLFVTLGWKPPKYAHIAPIQKIDGDSRRKLSKRWDPESSMEYYMEHGYPADAIKEYLLNIANSNFEDWRRANPTAPAKEFQVNLKKFNNSGGLLDMVKLDNISKNIIAKYSAEEIYKMALDWAKTYHTGLATKLEENREYFIRIFAIERRGNEVRKDIGKWSDIENLVSFFFVDSLDRSSAKEALKTTPTEDITSSIEKFAEVYSASLSKDEWLESIKTIAKELGYADSTKEFKEAAPGTYKGHFGAIAQVLRVAITGRTQTPDLYEVMQVLGEEECKKRLESFSL